MISEKEHDRLCMEAEEKIGQAERGLYAALEASYDVLGFMETTRIIEEFTGRKVVKNVTNA